MDGVIVGEKLDSLRDRIERIEQWIPDRHEDLENNRDAEDIVVHNFCHAVQICVDIAMHALSQAGRERPASMADAFDSLRRTGAISDSTARALKGAAHMRNIATHDYVRLDLSIVHAACTTHLGVFRSFAKEIGRFAGLGNGDENGTTQ